MSLARVGRALLSTATVILTSCGSSHPLEAPLRIERDSSKCFNLRIVDSTFNVSVGVQIETIHINQRVCDKDCTNSDLTVCLTDVSSVESFKTLVDGRITIGAGGATTWSQLYSRPVLSALTGGPMNSAFDPTQPPGTCYTSQSLYALGVVAWDRPPAGAPGLYLLELRKGTNGSQLPYWVHYHYEARDKRLVADFCGQVGMATSLFALTDTNLLEYQPATGDVVPYDLKTTTPTKHLGSPANGKLFAAMPMSQSGGSGAFLLGVPSGQGLVLNGCSVPTNGNNSCSPWGTTQGMGRAVGVQRHMTNPSVFVVSGNELSSFDFSRADLPTKPPAMGRVGTPSYVLTERLAADSKSKKSCAPLDLSSARAAAIGDLDQDMKDDLVVAIGSNLYWLPQTDDSLQPPPSPPSSGCDITSTDPAFRVNAERLTLAGTTVDGNISSLALLDLDGDGRKDIIAVSDNHQAYAWLNQHQP